MSTSPGQYQVQLGDGREVLVNLQFINGHYLADVDGQQHRLSMRTGKNGAVVVAVDGAGYHVSGNNGSTSLVSHDTTIPIGSVTAVCAGTKELTLASSKECPTAKTLHEVITSPLNGLVITLCVEEGERVSRGQPLMLIEAMKMENRITSPFDGRVASISAFSGRLVRLGDELIELEA